jgi:heat shock protein HslJ
VTSNDARAAATVLLSVAALLGCGGTAGKASPPPAARPLSQPAAPAGPLAGTRWRLVEIQSMDDSVGTRRPGDPAKFTMRLNGDGTVHMRLDCNRADGTWSVEPGADPSSGRFAFGPLAATRALCPPPNVDEQVTAQAPYIRGYALKDGRLSLTLVADGGRWLWEQDEGIALEPRS